MGWIPGSQGIPNLDILSMRCHQAQREHALFHFHTFSSIFHVLKDKMVNLSGNVNTNTVLSPGTCRVQLFLIG